MPPSRSVILALSYVIAAAFLISAALQVVPGGPMRTAIILVGSGLFVAAIATRFLIVTPGPETAFPWLLMLCWAAAAGFIVSGLTAVTPVGPARQFVLLSGTGAALAFLGWWFFSERGFGSFGTPVGHNDRETQQERDTRWTRDTVLTFSYVGIAGLILFSIRSVVPTGPVEGMFRVLGAGTLISCGSLLTGALLGFLFGIPRAQTTSKPHPADLVPPAAAGAGTLAAHTPPGSPAPPPRPPLPRPAQAEFEVNTNLEQISDWLTKIIVGLGLINLRRFPAYFQAVGTYFSGALGGMPGGESVTLALIILFLVCGFLLGYLLTRLFLTGAFTRAQSPADQLRDTLLAARSTGGGTGSGGPETHIEAIQKIDQVASRVSPDQLKQQVLALATEYNATRAAMSPGRDRTRKLDSLILRMQGLAKQAYGMLPELAAGPSDGERLAAIAFLQIIPNKDYIDWLAKRFDGGTPFVMYHAAIALRNAVDAFRKSDKDALTSAVNHALSQTPAGELNIRKPLDDALKLLTQETLE